MKDLQAKIEGYKTALHEMVAVVEHLKQLEKKLDEAGLATDMYNTIEFRKKLSRSVTFVTYDTMNLISANSEAQLC